MHMYICYAICNIFKIPIHNQVAFHIFKKTNCNPIHVYSKVNLIELNGIYSQVRVIA